MGNLWGQGQSRGTGAIEEDSVNTWGQGQSRGTGSHTVGEGALQEARVLIREGRGYTVLYMYNIHTVYTTQ